MISNLVCEQLKQLPARPGVYLMKDIEGSILYVGKATNLSHRVPSYFRSRQKLTPKLKRLVARVNELDYFVTTSEQEALILELNLIKRYHPRYNVQLKDDKTFPYLKIDLKEDWPRLQVTRRLEDDGGRYFGPFASARSLRQTLKVLKDIFPYRSCRNTITGSDRRPCLEYDIHHCLGPCVGMVSRRGYAASIKQIILFLEGKRDIVTKELQDQMIKAATSLDFERAARLRDQIEAIKRVIEGQKIAARVSGEQDVIAFAHERDIACVQVFFIRSGKFIGRESFVLQHTRSETVEQIMTSFVKQFYASTPHIPPRLLLQHSVADRAIIESWLSGKRGSTVKIYIPRRGRRKQLVDIVAENARQGLEQLKIKQLAAPATLMKALAEIQEQLSLPHPPKRMEGYDISNIQGTTAVGSMVVFVNGKPRPAQYRRFKIKTVAGANDYAMLQEVIKRRFKRRFRNNNGDDSQWALRPDLILIDGGKGQLNAVLAVITETSVSDVPAAALAKENEKIFLPQRSQPLVLPHSSTGLQLLQHLRDEAHRFALGYHRNIRRRQNFTSALDSVPGIGPKRKRTLLRQFGSVRGIKEASMTELAAASGMNQKLAQRVKEYL